MHKRINYAIEREKIHVNRTMQPIKGRNPLFWRMHDTMGKAVCQKDCILLKKEEHHWYGTCFNIETKPIIEWHNDEFLIIKLWGKFHGKPKRRTTKIA